MSTHKNSLESIPTHCENSILIPITIKRWPHGGGNAGGGQYEVTVNAVSLPEGAARITYQLCDDTPKEITFSAGVPTDPSQINLVGTSEGNREIIFSDINTVPETIDITLTFTDAKAHNSTPPLTYDPQIINYPTHR